MRRFSAKSNAKNLSLKTEDSVPSNDDDITMKVIRILVKILLADDICTP